MTIQALRERRAALAREVRNLMANNESTWNDSHTKEYDEKMAEIGRIEAQIKRIEQVNALDADNQFRNAGGREVDTTGENAATERGVFNTWGRHGFNALSTDQRQAYQNAMSTGVGGEGGYTVQNEVATKLVEALKAYGGVREVAEVIRTKTGAAMPFPTTDGTAEEGELVGENVAATNQDISFGTVGLDTYKFSSKTIVVPIELLQDSSINIEDLIVQRFIDRLGRVTNRYFTTGTGAAQPRGIVTASSLGKAGTTGQTGTVIYDDLVDLQHSVDPAYRRSGKCRFMMHDQSVKVVRKIKDTQGRPIFVPGYDQGNPQGEPDAILNTAITVNQDMATMAANAKSIVFGDLSKYKVRDVMQFTLHRFTDSKYAEKGQVGFLAWMRAGGNFTDIGPSLKHYQNSAT